MDFVDRHALKERAQHARPGMTVAKLGAMPDGSSNRNGPTLLAPIAAA